MVATTVVCAETRIVKLREGHISEWIYFIPADEYLKAIGSISTALIASVNMCKFKYRLMGCESSLNTN